MPTTESTCFPPSIPLELARYELDTGTRVLVATRIEDAIHITDRPASGEGRSYGVDTVTGGGEHLDAMIRDYVRQADLLGTCPMSPEGIEAMLAGGERHREAIS